jgi:tyrosinase
MMDQANGRVDRRALLLGGTALLAAGAAGGLLTGAEAQAAPRVRPDISSPAGQRMIALYALAVRAMQDPAINYPPQPHSWIFQSYIHSVPSNPFDPANSGGLYNGTPELATRIDQIYGNPAPGSRQAAWKAAALKCWSTCTHGSPLFPIWHRWYMYYFERVCRRMCGSATFQLPYWNYASNIGGSLQLPPAFVPQQTQPFPAQQRLVFDDRGPGFANPQGKGAQNVLMNGGGYLPYPLIDYQPALAATRMFPSDTSFPDPWPSPTFTRLGFTGRLECYPHDMVHNYVGGWMGNVPSAAGDPIFFVHHCQIDRLYASWEAKPGIQYNWGTTDDDPAEATWKGHASWFVDETGKPVSVRMGNAVDTAALGYRYDNLAQPVPPVSPLLQGTAAQPLTEVAAQRAAALDVRAGGAAVTLQPAPGLLAASPSTTGIPAVLTLSDVVLLRRPPAPLAVFVNLPEGTPATIDGPYYAGTLNLFHFDLGTGRRMMHGPGAAHAMAMTPDFTFAIGDLLRAQQQRRLWRGGAITVTVATPGGDQPGGTVYLTIGSIAFTP